MVTVSLGAAYRGIPVSDIHELRVGRAFSRGGYQPPTDHRRHASPALERRAPETHHVDT